MKVVTILLKAKCCHDNARFAANHYGHPYDILNHLRYTCILVNELSA